ncbi:MAG: hypothetical protein KGD58_16010 [Candidatus Lokiarchaeota archaeon]|nr:hypothetical protein [Candidatus Lokiarchaeota archaeon]
MSDESEGIKAFKAAPGASTTTAVAAAAALLGADLVVVALAWDHPPSEGGIVTITFLMMISFVAFINVLHQMMRFDYIITILNVKEKENKDVGKEYKEIHQISKGVRVLHVSGLLFTTIAFWIISYKYLVSINGYYIVILLLPFILFFLYWLPKIIGVEKEVGLLSIESLIQFLIQVLFLVLLCLDFFKIITIP